MPWPIAQNDHAKADSMKTAQRKKVFARYRGRGHKNSNLWLVYSPKMDRDYMFNSDIQFLYWLGFIEGCPEIKSFELAGGAINREPDFVLGYTDGRTVGAYVVAEHAIPGPQQLGTEDDSVPLISTFISVEDVKKRSTTAQRWLKPIAFAAAIRSRPLVPLHNALVLAEQQRGEGVLGELLKAVDDFPADEALGVIMRHLAAGIIEISLVSRSFGHHTEWKLRV